MCKLIEKTFTKLTITVAIKVSDHGRVNLKALTKCSTTLRLRFSALCLLEELILIANQNNRSAK